MRGTEMPGPANWLGGKRPTVYPLRQNGQRRGVLFSEGALTGHVSLHTQMSLGILYVSPTLAVGEKLDQIQVCS